MRTYRIPVDGDVELGVDRWDPARDDRPERGVDGADRPTFLLVHGLASNARLWDGVAVRLSDLAYPVVTVDLRGHGRSSKPEHGYDVPRVADDLAAVIEGLGLDRPIVAGQSWGGNVVLELAVRRPDACRGIVCVDGGWLEPSTIFPDWEACRTALAPPRLVGRPLTEIEGYLRASHPDWPEPGIRGALANFEVRPDDTIAPWLTYDHHIEVLRGLWEDHPSERFGAIRVPVLLVPADTGEADRTGRKRQEVAAAERAIGRSRAHWFVGDHDIHAQHPDELADVFDACVRDGFFS